MSWIEDGQNEYMRRLQRFMPVQVTIVREKYRANAGDADIRRQAAELLLARCEHTDYVVVLDPGGRQFDSLELAGELRQWQVRGVRRVAFLIGAHAGLDMSILEKRMNLTWSLSRLTLTHEMSRLLVFEQLYRACTINNGQHYHR